MNYFKTVIKNDYKTDHPWVFMQGKSGGCYNVDCPGFVQVSKDVTLGMIPAEYSQFGSAVQKSWNISIDKVLLITVIY